jgi:UDP-N-acetylglucosamine--N-acetylmuramyl-(pentapeptide) pyrophosphoryl-undecaprenol N-acetylglucosamine transferase
LPFLLLRSFFKTRKIISEFKPDVVVGTGGYASGPILRTATSKGIPTLIQEQNSYAGITNRILSKKVNRICVAYEGMENFFPKEKVVITGNPIRQDINDLESKKKEACNFFEVDPSRKTIVVIGGSLGARTINEAIGAGLEELAKNNIQLIWQTGKTYIEKARQQASGFSGKNIYAFDFIQRMDLAYAAADVVISRAGASSISELCVTGKPCILVPSPNVAEDHQTKNAMALVKKNAALLVKDEDASKVLINKAVVLLNDQNSLTDLKLNIKKMAFTDSANVIAREVLKLANYTE